MADAGNQPACRRRFSGRPRMYVHVSGTLNPYQRGLDINTMGMADTTALLSLYLTARQPC